MKNFLQTYKQKAVYEKDKDGYEKFIGKEYYPTGILINTEDIYKIIKLKKNKKYVKVLCRHRVTSPLTFILAVLIIGIPWAIVESFKTTSYIISYEDYRKLIG